MARGILLHAAAVLIGFLSLPSAAASLERTGPPLTRLATEPNVLILFDPSPSRSDSRGGQMRWEIAEDTLAAIIARYPNARFGLMRVDGSDYAGIEMGSGSPVLRQGGRILVPCGHGTGARILTQVKDLEEASPNQPRAWPNLAESLADAGRYFATIADETESRFGDGPPGFGFYQKNYSIHLPDAPESSLDATTHDDAGRFIDTTSPIEGFCQKNYVILITASTPRYDNDWSLVTGTIGDYVHTARGAQAQTERGDCAHGETACPDGGTYLDDVAAFLFEEDLRQSLGTGEWLKQNLTTYVIGYEAGSPLLRATARAGGGDFFVAGTGERARLFTALDEALEDVGADTASAATPAVIATETAGDDLLLQASFDPKAGSGDLKAFSLPLAKNPAPLWSAAALLADRDLRERRIFSRFSNLAPKKRFLPGDRDVTEQLADLWQCAPARVAERIAELGRQPLGQIIHGGPVVVGPPRFFHTGKGYRAFRDRWRNRPTLIYAGAHDGMLHAFQTGNGGSGTAGEQAWAYLPESVQPELLTAPPDRSPVDLQPVVADVWDISWDVHRNDGTSRDGDGWRTVLLGGNGFGGTSYFALDVTDPDPERVAVLWETTPPFAGALAHTRPVIGPLSPFGTWAALVTSGYREDGQPGGIAALAMTTGHPLAIWQGNRGADIRADTRTRSEENAYYTLSAPVVIDSNRDGMLDLGYAGDSEGILWKFFFDRKLGVWRSNARFSTCGRPITSQPALVFDRQGNLRVYFGTGKYLIETDNDDTTRNAFYCLIERPVKTEEPGAEKFTWMPFNPQAPYDLLEVTDLKNGAAFDRLDETSASVLRYQGWFFELEATAGRPAERVINHPLVLDGKVFFTSFTPSDDPCHQSGTSKLYAVEFDTGLQARIASQTVLRTTGGGNLPAGQRYGYDAEGVTSDLRWRYDRSGRSNHLLFQTSDAEIHQIAPLLDLHLIRMRSWRERDL